MKDSFCVEITDLMLEEARILSGLSWEDFLSYHLENGRQAGPLYLTFETVLGRVAFREWLDQHQIPRQLKNCLCKGDFFLANAPAIHCAPLQENALVKKIDPHNLPQLVATELNYPHRTIHLYAAN